MSFDDHVTVSNLGPEGDNITCILRITESYIINKEKEQKTRKENLVTVSPESDTRTSEDI